MSIFEASPHEHIMRRLNSCAHTLCAVADFLDDIDEPEDPDDRADLVILVENIQDVVSYLTDRAREIAWLHTPVPEHEE
jgi:hypothetical protein